MITKEKPISFHADYEVVSCFCEKDGKHLLLHRNANKLMGGKWGPPAGKVDLSEKLVVAICRETYEETGLDISEREPKCINKYFVTHPKFNFIYHVFSVNVEDSYIVLNPEEHQNYSWVSPEEALTYDLVDDQDFVIKDYYKKIGVLN